MREATAWGRGLLAELLWAWSPAICSWSQIPQAAGSGLWGCGLGDETWGPHILLLAQTCESRDNYGWPRLESSAFPTPDYFWKGAVLKRSCCHVVLSLPAAAAPFPAGFFFLITRPGNYPVLLFILIPIFHKDLPRCISGGSETLCCPCSKARQEACPQHTAERGSESAELPLTMIQNWELLSRARHDGEQAAGNSLAQSPPQ